MNKEDCLVQGGVCVFLKLITWQCCFWACPVRSVWFVFECLSTQRKHDTSLKELMQILPFTIMYAFQKLFPL